MFSGSNAGTKSKTHQQSLRVGHEKRLKPAKFSQTQTRVLLSRQQQAMRVGENIVISRYLRLEPY